MIPEWAGFAADCVSAIAAVAAVAVAGVTLNRARKEQRQAAERENKRAVLEAYNRLQEQVFDKINPVAPKEIAAIAEDRRSTQYKELGGYLARIEHFCTGVNQGIYDFETVYELGHGYFDGPQLKGRLEPLISKKQANTEYDYFANIHLLWQRMDEETERRKRKAAENNRKRNGGKEHGKRI